MQIEEIILNCSNDKLMMQNHNNFIIKISIIITHKMTFYYTQFKSMKLTASALKYQILKTA